MTGKAPTNQPAFFHSLSHRMRVRHPKPDQATILAQHFRMAEQSNSVRENFAGPMRARCGKCSTGYRVIRKRPAE
jgi:hypothetical protein